jgi:hypothetical protein
VVFSSACTCSACPVLALRICASTGTLDTDMLYYEPNMCKVNARLRQPARD